MINEYLKAPFTYFGGKSCVADLVWNALGDVPMYYEPFFGSGAVLLKRPGYDSSRHTETVNDKCGYVANVWRSLQKYPEEVARWCDYPINHADLSARRKRLIECGDYLLSNLIADEDWCDTKLAGYWIWGISAWIGSGFTFESSSGIGKRPRLADKGTGVHKISLIDNTNNKDEDDSYDDIIREGASLLLNMPYNTNIYKWFRKLAERLRYVRVTCRDWTCICNGNWQDSNGIAGFYFDPPYGVKDRDTKLYHHDSTEIAKDVLEWCKQRGDKHTYRIVISGYEEYDELVKDFGWSKINWSANGGYSNYSKTNTKNNRHRETLYFSPYCVQNQMRLFI